MTLFKKGKGDQGGGTPKAPAFSPIDRIGLLGLLDQVVNGGQSGVLELREPRGNWVYAFQAGALTHASGGRVRGARHAFDLLWEFQSGEFMFTPGVNPSLAGNLYIDKGRLTDLLRRSQAALQGPSAPYIPPDQQRPIAPAPRPPPPAAGLPPPARAHAAPRWRAAACVSELPATADGPAWHAATDAATPGHAAPDDAAPAGCACPGSSDHAAELFRATDADPKETRGRADLSATGPCSRTGGPIGPRARQTGGPKGRPGRPARQPRRPGTARAAGPRRARLGRAHGAP